MCHRSFSRLPGFSNGSQRDERLLGLDVGTKTIGLALSDVMRQIATPLETIRRTKFAADAARLLALGEGARRWRARASACRSISTAPRGRARNRHGLSHAIWRSSPICRCAFWDERLSTAAAERALLEADTSRKRRAELIDKMAAAYILQGALDRHDFSRRSRPVMIAILTALAPLFLYLGDRLRAGAREIRRRGGCGTRWITSTFYVLFPALLAKTLMRADLGSVPALDFVAVSIGSITIMAGAVVATYLATSRPLPGPTFTSFFQGAIRWQSTVAVAISAALFGERGLTFAALSVASLIPVVQLYTVLVLLIFGRGNEGIRLLPMVQRLALNPLALACLLGLVLNATGVPDFVYQTFSLLEIASIALTLLAVGAGLNLGSAHAPGASSRRTWRCGS